MNFTVKITTFKLILDLFYPCYCRGCGKIGEAFCSRCYNYNKALNPPFSRALLPDFHKLFVCGLREGALSSLISEYKFHSRVQYLPILAQMISEVISSELPPNTLIVPLPTVRKHIRGRGFDHILELALQVSEKTGLKVVSLLSRRRETVQVGKSGVVRWSQAREAFSVDLEAISNCFQGSSPSFKDFSRPILILDDVWTTGASMRSASFLLRSFGFQKVYGVVIAKNDGYEFS